MDNNAFETEMINSVNENAEFASMNLDSQFVENARKWMERRKEQRIRAIVELVCWVLGCVVIGTAFSYANTYGMVGGWLAVVVPSAFTWVAGIRVGGLIRSI